MSIRWKGIRYPTDFIFKWCSWIYAVERRGQRCRQNTFRLDGTATFEFEDGFIVKGASQNSIKFWDEETRQRVLKRHLEIKARMYPYKHGDKYRKFFDNQKKQAMRTEIEKETGLKIPKKLKKQLAISSCPNEVYAAAKYLADAMGQSVSEWVVEAIIQRVERDIVLDQQELRKTVNGITRG